MNSLTAFFGKVFPKQAVIGCTPSPDPETKPKRKYTRRKRRYKKRTPQLSQGHSVRITYHRLGQIVEALYINSEWCPFLQRNCPCGNRLKCTRKNFRRCFTQWRKDQKRKWSKKEVTSDEKRRS